jgi:hypothetical protein
VGYIVKGKHAIIVIWPLLIYILVQTALVAGCTGMASASYTVGVWDNFDYSKPVDYWTSSARSFGGDATVIDLAVVQARDGYAALPFPFSNSGTLCSVSDTDLLEPYLSRLDSEGIGAILSVQPMDADITDLIGIILDRYGHHRCLAGINIDLEWKRTGNPQHASNQERDAWTGKINRYGSQLKLFLTFFKDYTYFPDDDGKMVVMYDGTQDTQENLLNAYGGLAKHFAAVGIYTGYPTSRPATASDDSILAAAPNTRYIIHVDPDPGTIASKSDTGILQRLQPESKTSGMSGLFDKFKLPAMSGSSLQSGAASTGSFGGSLFSDMRGNFPERFGTIGQGDRSDGTEGVGAASAGGQKASVISQQSMPFSWGSGFGNNFAFSGLTGAAKQFFGAS